MAWTAENEKRMRTDIAASEQIAREQGIPPRRVTLTHEDAAAALGEIERLTVELAARAPAARYDHGINCPCPACSEQTAAMRDAPADASLEARAALRDTFSKLVHIDHMARHLCENSGIDHTKDPPEATVDVADLTALGGALDAIDPTEEHDEGQRDRLMAVLDAVDASRPAAPEIDAEDLWTDYRTGRGTVFASDRKAFLAGVAAGRRTVDAIRPGLTEEQARALTRHARALARVARITLRGHGYYGFRTAQYGEADALRAKDRKSRASRGETGPAPAGLTRAMHDAAQRPSVPPDLGPGIGGAPIRIRPTVLTASAVEEWPEPELSGLTCPGCYAATGIAQPHDPRAALHEDDPERKTATLAGGGTGND